MRFKLTLQFSMVFLITALIIMCGVIISSISYYGTKSSVHFLINSMMQKIAHQVHDETLNYLKPASVINHLSTFLVEDFVDVSNDNEMHKYLHSNLAANDQFVNVFFGKPSGNFLMAKRQPDQSFSFETIRREGHLTITNWEHQHQKWEEQFPNTVKHLKEGYDPRQRPWYQKALEYKGMIWTDVYVFYHDKEPGITNAIPILDAENQLIGVLGIDIGIKNLSYFLGTLRIGQHGKAFILNHKNQIVALPLAKGEQPLKLYREIKLGNEIKYTLTTLEHSPEKEYYHSFEAYKKALSQSGPDRSDQAINFSFKYNEQDYLARYIPLVDERGLDWKIGIIVPENDFLHLINRNNRFIFMATLVLIIFTILIGVYLSRNISKPLKELSQEMDKVKKFDLNSELQIQTSLYEVNRMLSAFTNMKNGLRSFSKYVPFNLVRDLIDIGDESFLGGKKEELTIFFSDIADFTSISENKASEELVEALGDYFNEMSSIVIKYQGTVDKYIGDGIMAFWGAPKPLDNHAELACLAAIEMQQRLTELANYWRESQKPVFETRIGISTGEVIVGNMGSNERMDYTVIGDRVNVASRLEGLNKDYNTGIIISESTYQQVKNKVEARFLDYVIVKGKKESIAIYELVGEKGKVEGAQKSVSGSVSSGSGGFSPKAV